MMVFLLPAVLLILPIVSADLKKIGRSNNEFAVDMYQTLRSDARQNIIFSPLSISTAMAMTYLGSAGNTKAQMAQGLHFDALGNSVHQLFKDLHKRLQKDSQNYTLKTANSLFGNVGYTFLDSYLQGCADFYQAEVKELDFTNQAEASTSYINKWVENKTENKIKKLIPEGAISDVTVLVLVNALYFKGLWKYPFEAAETRSASFNLNSNQKTNVQMMHHKEYFRRFYSQELNTNILEMDFAGDEISMYFLVPEDMDRGLDKLEKQLTATSLTAALTSTTRSTKMKMDIYVPKLKVESKFSLSNVMKSLKMTDMFSEKADFSGMDGKKDLSISDVLHKSFIDINEEGSEAAAATGVIVGLTSVLKPFEFKVDRPFFLVLKDKESDSILMMGSVWAPPGVPVPAALSGGTQRVLIPCLIALVSFLAILMLK